MQSGTLSPVPWLHKLALPHTQFASTGGVLIRGISGGVSPVSDGPAGLYEPLADVDTVDTADSYNATVTICVSLLTCHGVTADQFLHGVGRQCPTSDGFNHTLAGLFALRRVDAVDADIGVVYFDRIAVSDDGLA